MKLRPFGSTSLAVSEVGFGCSRVVSVFGRQGSAAAVDLLREAADRGINFFDTADIYSNGEAETLLGRAFRRGRARVVIATKGGYRLPAQRRLLARVKPLARPLVRALGLRRESLPAAVTGVLSQDFSRRALAEALEASLRRLGTDHVDIYQLHSPPPEVIRSGEASQILESFRASGKVRYCGVATDSAADAALCLGLPEIASVQVPFGWLDPEAKDDVLPRAAERGLGIIARGCFGAGLLKDSLSVEELRAATPKWARILELRRLAASRGRSALGMALQFALGAPGVSVALIGMRNAQHLAGTLAEYWSRPLDDAESAALDELTEGKARHEP